MYSSTVLYVCMYVCMYVCVYDVCTVVMMHGCTHVVYDYNSIQFNYTFICKYHTVDFYY